MAKRVILHCINNLGVGGAEILLRNTVKLLDQFDHVICHLNFPSTLEPDFTPYPVYNLKHTSLLNGISSIRRLRKIIKRHKVEIIHSHLFESTLLARLASSSKISFFFTVHNPLSNDAFDVNPISTWAEKMTYKREQTIIGVSGDVLRDYSERIGIKGKSFVLHNYVDEIFFTRSYDNSANVSSGLRLVAVGNLRRQKNYFRLLDAFSLLQDIPVTLDIYGSGYLENELLRIIKERKMNVRLMGRTEKVAEVLPSYHAYIMPSIFEGFGIAPMEAMAMGMPVILSDLPVFREVAEDLPVYFNPNSATSIANAIRYTYANWNELNRGADERRVMIERKASKGVYLSKLMKIYNS